MEIEELLEQIRKIKTQYDKNEHGANFNIFDICVKHDEAKNSAIIAEFLNPRGSHGCGSVFFKNSLKL